ncbi:hypothetical protein M407DRAFT_224305 [Tulasnella calospora MUT 4182]|uniref:Uncharacterized protein n=1 Tax=Tulasnella calospora MUT 4182 TaxID=1051891 RepID=A0A0C3KBY0_9AGAM|nr:hypothetical protein M407DRAFT_224305 [Tulasnella calospora MUT 4182]
MELPPRSEIRNSPGPQVAGQGRSRGANATQAYREPNGAMLPSTPLNSARYGDAPYSSLPRRPLGIPRNGSLPTTPTRGQPTALSSPGGTTSRERTSVIAAISSSGGAVRIGQQTDRGAGPLRKLTAFPVADPVRDKAVQEELKPFFVRMKRLYWDYVTGRREKRSG